MVLVLPISVRRNPAGSGHARMVMFSSLTPPPFLAVLSVPAFICGLLVDILGWLLGVFGVNVPSLGRKYRILFLFLI